MSDLVRLMQARFQRLYLDFELTFSAEQISHSGERGQLLEETLKNFLVEVLPKRVGVGSGQIVGAFEREPSKQIDIVLYDAFNYSLLLNEGSFQLFPNEAVLATIEVKSKLNKKYLKEGVENIASSKILRKFPMGEHPSNLGTLFCFETEWKQPKTLLRNLYKVIDSNQEYTPDLICSLNPGFLLAASDSLGESVSRLPTLLAGREPDNKFPANKFILISPMDFSKEHILLWFYLIVTDYLNRILDIGVNMAQYTKSSTAWTIDIIDLEEFLRK